MKKNKIGLIKSLLFLFLAVVLVAGGTTIAWFTAQHDIPSAAEMVAGTLEFEIINLSEDAGPAADLEEGAPEWQAGECKDFSWILKNTGSKRSYYRACAGSFLEKFDLEETAWGEGEYFNPGKDRAMFFTHNPGSITKAKLLTGQQLDLGTVTVREEAGRLSVRFETKDGWFLTGSYLVAAGNSMDLPANSGGNLVPGQFQYKNSHLSVPDFTYVLDLTVNSPICLAAYCKVVKEGTRLVDNDRVNWSLPDGSAWVKGRDGWFYSSESVGEGGEILLVLWGCLAEDAGNGLFCNVQLEAEAVQASHDAADEIWPGRFRLDNEGEWR